MSATTAPPGPHPVDQQVRVTLRVAMLIFVYTIGIGILNGLDLVEFSRQQLLSHLHGGTLGWMTLAIIAATQWLFVDAGTTVCSSPSASTSLPWAASPGHGRRPTRAPDRGPW